MRARLLLCLSFAACSGSDATDAGTARDAGPNVRRDAGMVDRRDAGVAPDASTNPPSTDLAVRLGGRDVTGVVDFGARFVGEREAAITFVIENRGTDRITLHPDTPISVAGASGEFRVEDPAASTIAPGGETTFTIEPAPTTAGRANATVRVHHADGTIGPTSIEVSGYGHGTGTPYFIGGGGAFFRVRTTTGEPGDWTTYSDRLATEPCDGLGPDHPRDLIRGIGYGDGTFVLAGGSCLGMLATSRDGENWNGQIFDPPHAGFYSDVAFLDGTFSAVGGLGGRAYSTDRGDTWTVTGDYSKCHLRRVAAGNGRFVAVGDEFGEGCSTSSTDGVTWSPIATGGAVFATVMFGNGVFVAMGDGRCATSADGLTWDTCDANAPMTRTMFFANGRFIAFGPDGIQHSEDGRNWETVPGPWMDVIAFGAGRYVTIGFSSRGYGATLDALTLEQEMSGASDFVYGHAYP